MDPSPPSLTSIGWITGAIAASYAYNPPEELVARRAYAAGIVDGEGTIRIWTQYRQRKTRKSWEWNLTIKVTNTDFRMIKWLQDYFGGSVRAYANQNHRPYAEWHLHAKQAEAFLKEIRPYLIAKAEQADIALAFRATFVGHHRNGRGLSVVNHEERRAFQAQLKAARG